MLIAKGSKWAIDKSKRSYLERTRDELKQLYRAGELKKPYEISELLPWMLAQDINHHLAKHPEERLVLFVDEYERVFDEGGAGARWRENPFDRHMRTLVQESNGLLAVFFSRERLPWGDDPDWRAELADAQHLLDGLAKPDADKWLRQIPIDDGKIRAAILNGAREEPRDGAPVYPLMLELQVEHWRALTANETTIAPEHFHVTAETFEGRCQELVGRLLRDYGAELQVTLERLSVANRFDRAALEHVVVTFGTGLSFDSFERIAGLSFISESEDGFLTMHRAVAEAIRTTLGEEQYSTSTKALFEHYETRAAMPSPRDVTDETISALFEAAYLRRQAGLDGYVDWLAKFSAPISTAARYATAEQLWRETLHVIADRFGPDHPDAATSYNNVASNLNAQGRYGEADPLLRKALEINERVLGADHPDTATSYTDSS